MKQLIALVLVAAAAAVVAASAAATPPEPTVFEMNGTFTPTSPTSGTVTGTWHTTGGVNDAGTYTETVEFDGHSIHVIKQLSGSKGTIVLAAQGVYDVVAGGTLAVFRDGSWRIAGGTGAYTDLHGGGQPVTAQDSFGSFVTGQVHITHVGSTTTTDVRPALPQAPCATRHGACGTPSSDSTRRSCA